MSSRVRGLLVAVLLVTLGVAMAVVLSGGGDRVRVEALRVAGAGGVSLDADLYVPDSARHRPAPAVVVGHGFGGDKHDVAADARDLARAGYVVLAPTARGFGASGGRIGLDLPDQDAADLSAELDLLARRPEVQLDAPGDPRVAVVGASYGGGLALTGASHDRRVDAVVAVITWHSLASALLPNAADPAGGAQLPGVFRQQAASGLFAAGGATPGRAAPCGRFAPTVCAAYAAAGSGSVGSRPVDAATLRLLDSSGAGPGLRVPTLLLQGEDDTLFPLSEAVATYAQLRAASIPVAMAWLEGGHDAPFGDAATQLIRHRTRAWLDRWLRGRAVDTGPGFSWFEPTSGRTGSAPAFPMPAAATRRFVLGAGGRLTQDGVAGPPEDAVAPPTGRPAAISTLPGLGALGGLLGPVAGRLLATPPGQAASWTSDPLPGDLRVVGASRVTLQVTGAQGGPLFARLEDVAADGSPSLVGGQVAPLRVPAGRDPVRLDVALPDAARTVPAGHRLRLSIVTTDAAFLTDPRPRTVTVAGAGPLLVPVAPPVAGSSALAVGIAIGLAALVVLALLSRAVTTRHRRAADAHRGDPAATPVVVRGLSKTYADGTRAVDDVSFTVERGQVVGLLGPNGSGKTTTLRMVLGLIQPTAGEAEVFGERITPGAPVLGRLGTFVEGPGLLPHLSGRDNLELWWRSTGADLADAHLDEALDVAGLGAAVDRPVRTYSQGMRQRLAIAQALLGRPDCLVLDEPTNGLDPPQIRELRDLVRRVAAEGRTVLLSSHLLSEVEVTCTHAVVMRSGRVVHAGPVEELLARGTRLRVRVAGDPEAAAAALRADPAAESVEVAADGTLAVVPAPAGDADPRAAVVATLVRGGHAVVEVGRAGRLEDVFLDLVGASVEGHAVGSGGRS